MNETLSSNTEPLSVIIRNMVITFIEAAVGIWYASGMQTDKAAIGVAIAGGISVVWNTLGKPLFKKWGWIK